MSTPLDRLKSQLLTSGIQEENAALFQVISQLIDYLRGNITATQNILNGPPGGGGGGGGLLGATYLTKSKESGLPNSKRVIAGSGIEFNDANGRRVISTAIPFGMDSGGEPGEDGFGYPGINGKIGINGLPGMNGIQFIPLDGDDGIDGEPGSIGPQGFPGTQGGEGAPGIPGIDGEEGDSGPDGMPGGQGLDGSIGPSGPQGTSGSTSGPPYIEPEEPPEPLMIPGPAGAGITPTTGYMALTEAAAPASKDFSAEGTLDWFIGGASATLPRLQSPPHRKVLGECMFLGFDWVWPEAAFTQAGGVPTATTTQGDTTNTAQAALATRQGVYRSAAGAVNYGLTMTVRARKTRRFLRLYYSHYSSIVTIIARLSDGSTADVSTTQDSGAAAGANRMVTVEYNSSEDNATLTLSIITTTNRGSTPNVMYVGATLASS